MNFTSSLSRMCGHLMRSFKCILPNDSHLPEVVDGIAASLVNVCAAITYGVAQAQASLVPAAAAPSELSPVDDPSNSPQFVNASDPTCSDWAAVFEKFDADTANWRTQRTDIPADQWTPEQKALNEAVVPVMNTFADDLERLGRSSGNPVLEDFAVLVGAVPTCVCARAILVHFCRQLPCERFHEFGEVGVLRLQGSWVMPNG